MAHAAIADHGLVPDFAKGSDPFVRLVAAGHSIAAACESLHPDAKPGSASTSVFPDRPSSRDHRPLSPRAHPPRAGRVPGGERYPSLSHFICENEVMLGDLAGRHLGDRAWAGARRGGGARAWGALRRGLVVGLVVAVAELRHRRRFGETQRPAPLDRAPSSAAARPSRAAPGPRSPGRRGGSSPPASSWAARHGPGPPQPRGCAPSDSPTPAPRPAPLSPLAPARGHALAAEVRPGPTPDELSDGQRAQRPRKAAAAGVESGSRVSQAAVIDSPAATRRMKARTLESFGLTP